MTAGYDYFYTLQEICVLLNVLPNTFRQIAREYSDLIVLREQVRKGRPVMGLPRDNFETLRLVVEMRGKGASGAEIRAAVKAGHVAAAPSPGRLPPGHRAVGGFDEEDPGDEDYGDDDFAGAGPGQQERAVTVPVTGRGGSGSVLAQPSAKLSEDAWARYSQVLGSSATIPAKAPAALVEAPAAPLEPPVTVPPPERFEAETSFEAEASFEDEAAVAAEPVRFRPEPPTLDDGRYSGRYSAPARDLSPGRYGEPVVERPPVDDGLTIPYRDLAAAVRAVRREAPLGPTDDETPVEADAAEDYAAPEPAGPFVPVELLEQDDAAAVPEEEDSAGSAAAAPPGLPALVENALVVEIAALRDEIRQMDEKRQDERDKLITTLMRTQHELQSLRYEVGASLSRRDRKRRRGFWAWLFDA